MRPSRDQWAMSLAISTASRTTCLRRGVGCIMLNARGHVIATGYNGVATGLPHCNDEKEIPVYHDDPRVTSMSRIQDLSDCWEFNGKQMPKFHSDWLAVPGNKQCVGFEKIYPHACSGSHAPSGTNLDGCQAIHAEQNALLQCQNVYDIDTCYVTASPCITCTKLLLNTGCKRIVFAEEYPHPEAGKLWKSSGREWAHVLPNG